MAGGINGKPAEKRPLISVLMANFRSAPFLPQALESVLSQTVRDLELIVSDDASPDESTAIVQRFMAADSRVRLIAAEKNSGPGAARNRALEAARGEWIAVVDSDDIIHPQRFEILLAAAQALNADGIADDLLFFSDSGGGGTLLGETAGSEARLISPAYFVRSNTSGSGLPPLGYLKPLMKREKLGSLRYDEGVRIGEDYDFLLRFLFRGGRFFLFPELLYLYRRHSQSISHRLSESTVKAMIANQEALVAETGALPAEIEDLLAKRMSALRSALSFERLVLAIKQRRPLDALKLLGTNPRLVLPLAKAISENLQSRLKRSTAPEKRGPRAVALGDQDRPPNADALHAALGFSHNIEAITVPPYVAAMDRKPTGGKARALQLRLVELAMRSQLDIVCYGLSGLYASGFLPRKQMAAVVVQKGEELAPIREWLASSPAQLILADDILDRVSPDLETEAFCPGYHLVRPKEARPLTGRTRKATKRTTAARA